MMNVLFLANSKIIQRDSLARVLKDNSLRAEYIGVNVTRCSHSCYCWISVAEYEIAGLPRQSGELTRGWTVKQVKFLA